MTDLHENAVDSDIRRGLTPEVLHGWDNADARPRDQSAVDRWGAEYRATASCQYAGKKPNVDRWQNYVRRAVEAGRIAEKEKQRERRMTMNQRLREARAEGAEEARQAIEVWNWILNASSRPPHVKLERLTGGPIPKNPCRACDGEGFLFVVGVDDPKVCLDCKGLGVQ